MVKFPLPYQLTHQYKQQSNRLLTFTTEISALIVKLVSDSCKRRLLFKYFVCIFSPIISFNENCAVDVHGPSGGWWYVHCYYSKLNAEWGLSTRTTVSGRNNRWYHWKDDSNVMKTSVMKFRCD